MMLSVVDWFGYNLSPQDRMRIIKEAGFDSGHCNVFTPGVDLLSLYGDKLMALHLHDNNGADDWHSLPFSGNIDWNEISNHLSHFSYNGAIALEIGNKKFEHIENPNEFLKLAALSAERMRKLCNSECQL